MDAYSSGEDLLIKTRKPYTITKQRERWTEEEHNRFLEALKLYGRAWQRIAEHIGTKTAVQIRSHAQKFFSKLEKEALAKGVPVGQGIDIEIPPPRPKKKPNNPYPRKTSVPSYLNTQVTVKDGKPIPPGRLHSTDKVVDLENELVPEKVAGDNGKENGKKRSHNDECTETCAQAAHLIVAASVDENSAITIEAARASCNLKESGPMKKQLIDSSGSDSGCANGPYKNHKADKPDTVKTVEKDTENDMQAVRNIPRHASIQIPDGSIGACIQALPTDVSQPESAIHQTRIPGHPVLFSNSAVSAAVGSQNITSRSTHEQILPSSHPPFIAYHNSQEHYSSYLQMSSTLSSLIVSALLQNPAAHAAATFAASFWPSTNMESSSNCHGSNGRSPPRPMNTAPSMATLAAATVAAATAWWAANGLLPMFAPPLAGFSCPPASVTTPSTYVAQTQPVNQQMEDNVFQKGGLHDQPSDQELSEALQPQHSGSKSSETSSSNSGKSSGAKTKIVLPDIDNEKIIPVMNEQKESNKGTSKKQVDRSSCGSNTPSGSDIEIDALEKNDQTKEEAKEPDASHPGNDIGNRRNRVATNMNDNWKEVSQGGRLAFQALFSREVLPQSFSPLENVSNVNKENNVCIEENRQNAEESNKDASKVELNGNTWESCLSDQDLVQNGLKEKNEKDGLLTIGLQGKLKSRRTGFKPYKRCSLEARECRVNSSSQDQESCSKRLRLEEEASI